MKSRADHPSDAALLRDLQAREERERAHLRRVAESSPAVQRRVAAVQVSGVKQFHWDPSRVRRR